MLRTLGTRPRATGACVLVVWLWVMAGPALAAPSGGDGYVRTDYRWELGPMATATSMAARRRRAKWR